MQPKVSLNIWLLLTIIGQISAVSYNQPKFCSNASWNPNATTFADNRTVGQNPRDIFINTNNTIYVANQEKGRIIVWSNESANPTKNISNGVSYPHSLFVTTSGDIYIDAYNLIRTVRKWTENSTTALPTMYVCKRCYDLFVDIDNTLYCSMSDLHQVVTKSLNTASNAFTITVGTGINGSASNRFNNPRGIFVDINFDLYVADSDNHRIQRFRSGGLNGTTVAGSTSLNFTITLKQPTAIVLDADGYLFIVDSGNHRIVGSGPHGFRCLVGCSGSSGFAANQLNNPWSLSFDSYGNMFVVDFNQHRVQKFLLSTNSCDGNATSQTTTTTTTLQTSSTVGSTNSTTNVSKTVSYNQPKFDAYATWSANAITFATSSTVGLYPYGIFVDKNNNVYVNDKANNRIQVWLNNSINPTRTLSGNFLDLYSIFVSTDDDIYVTNSYSTKRVDKWTLATNTRTAAMSIDEACLGLFIDLNDVLYCSIRDRHKVVTKPLSSVSTTLTVIAGTGCPGNTRNTLNNPHGIFVDINFDLYVADCDNDRIQLFRPGQLDGTTAAGSTSFNTTITLNCPTGVVLDNDSHLFIVDNRNHRIVGSGPQGFRCLVGCYRGGAASNELQYPGSMAFDSNGNIFVTDQNNSRIQKFILLNNTLPVSYNQPKFCASTTWNPNAITFASGSLIGYSPYGLFIDLNNTIYVADHTNDRIQIWFNNSVNLTKTISNNIRNPYSIFVTSIGDIYINYDQGSWNGNYSVDKWILNTTTRVPVMNVQSACYDLFVDISNTLYCSMAFGDRVVKRWLGDNVTTLTTVAGTGVSGSASDRLFFPYGIFVDTNFDLYVADCLNDRIQLFHLGQLNGKTVAGNTSPNPTVKLNCPTKIVLDADKYLFIVSRDNHRIIRSGPNGFRCIAGCSRKRSSASYQLHNPWSLSFDSYGNMYVADNYNHRIQKFTLSTNSCALLSYNQPQFCPSAKWDPNATTFATNNTVGTSPYAIFITTNNMIYVTDQQYQRIQTWSDNNTNPTRTIPGNLSESYSMFVTNNDDIYVSNNYSSSKVDKWSLNGSTNVFVMNVSSPCYGLFVDINNTLYCSINNNHKVVKRWLDVNTTTATDVAGTGTADNTSSALNSPHGIFVDINFDLYVADCRNNRVQLFVSGQSNGTTVVGISTLNPTIALDCPIGIVLDADKYLFVVDSGNHRIVRSGPYDSQCVVGCAASSGSAPNQLNHPRSLSFDSHGNIFVVDTLNSRIQKFVFLTNSCLEISPELSTEPSILSSSLLSTIDTTSADRNTNAPASSFVPPSCPGQNTIGTNCNISTAPCDMLQPCQNNGTCNNTNTTIVGYICTCPRGFDGTNCQLDNRPCKLLSCVNNGICIETSNTTFKCLCPNGYKGLHCESMINYCDNVTCFNNGVCRPLLLNYSCECLGSSSSGRHCEIVATRIVVLRAVSKSFGYIAILFLTLVVSFFVVMDILKYCFGIDPTKDELEKIRRVKAAKRAVKRPPVIQRFTYVPGPLEQQPPRRKLTKANLQIKETTV